MPENVMLNHNYVMAEGGTGVRALLAAHMYLSAKAYAAGENGRTENWKFIYETMDAGAEEIEQLQKLVRLDSESEFCDPHYSFHFCRLAEKVKEKLARDNTMSLKKIAPAWYRNGLLLTEEQLERDLLGGYYRDLTLGSVVSSAAMQCALETEEDRNAGFRAIADSVVASNNTYETRVVMVGSGIGGEGRTNLCTHPAMLRKLCVERVMEDLRMEQEQAKAYVEQNLKIAVIMTGSAFRFPAMNGLDQDVAGLVAGTLRNFPEDSAEAVNLFYLLEHDQCPVQATKASDSREQYKHKCQKQQDIRYDRCIKIDRKNLACELIHFFLIAPVFCSFSYCISCDAKSCDQRKVADNRYGKIVFSNRIYLKYSCDIRKCDQWKYQRQYRFHNIDHCV